MAATRTQLIDRWETPEGLRLAEEVHLALTPTRIPGKLVATPAGVAIPLEVNLRQRLAHLPFADEVTPQVDLRGLHVPNQEIDLVHVDVSGARLDYAFELSTISESKLDGTILDGCHDINGSFRGDFRQVSFVGATLHGVTFRSVNLSRANLRRAGLVKTVLREAVCQETNFMGADLRFSDCLRADFRGADLREANLTEASLANILFDEHTRLRGAILRGARMKADFIAFAQQSGAILGDSHNALTLAELDATIRMLQEHSDATRLAIALPFVETARHELARNPEYNWGDPLAAALTNAGHPELVDAVLELWSEAGKGLGYYL